MNKREYKVGDKVWVMCSHKVVKYHTITEIVERSGIYSNNPLYIGNNGNIIHEAAFIHDQEEADHIIKMLEEKLERDKKWTEDYINTVKSINFEKDVDE